MGRLSLFPPATPPPSSFLLPPLFGPETFSCNAASGMTLILTRNIQGAKQHEHFPTATTVESNYVSVPLTSTLPPAAPAIPASQSFVEQSYTATNAFFLPSTFSLQIGSHYSYCLVKHPLGKGVPIHLQYPCLS